MIGNFATLGHVKISAKPIIAQVFRDCNLVLGVTHHHKNNVKMKYEWWVETQLTLLDRGIKRQQPLRIITIITQPKGTAHEV